MPTTMLAIAPPTATIPPSSHPSRARGLAALPVAPSGRGPVCADDPDDSDDDLAEDEDLASQPLPDEESNFDDFDDDFDDDFEEENNDPDWDHPEEDEPPPPPPAKGPSKRK